MNVKMRSYILKAGGLHIGRSEPVGFCIEFNRDTLAIEHLAKASFVVSTPSTATQCGCGLLHLNLVSAVTERLTLF